MQRNETVPMWRYKPWHCRLVDGLGRWMAGCGVAMAVH